MQNQLQISRIDNNLDAISADFGEFNTATERVSAEYRGSFRIDQNNRLQFGLEQIDEEFAELATLERIAELEAVGGALPPEGSRWYLVGPPRGGTHYRLVLQTGEDQRRPITFEPRRGKKPESRGAGRPANGRL